MTNEFRVALHLKDAQIIDSKIDGLKESKPESVALEVNRLDGLNMIGTGEIVTLLISSGAGVSTGIIANWITAWLSATFGNKAHQNNSTQKSNFDGVQILIDGHKASTIEEITIRFQPSPDTTSR